MISIRMANHACGNLGIMQSLEMNLYCPGMASKRGVAGERDTLGRCHGPASLPVSPPTPRAVVLKFQDKKESAVLVLQNSCIREESLGFFPQCHPQAHSARASLGEQAKGLSSPRQRVQLRAHRHLRETKTWTWSLKTLLQIIIHKMNL